MISVRELVTRMQHVNVLTRYEEHERLDEVLAGTYQPDVGHILPAWKQGSSRHAAFHRALRKVQTEGPRVLRERIASAYGTITWVNADTGEEDERIDAELDKANLRALARNALTDYITHGIAAVLPYRDDNGVARLDRLGGMVEPYSDPDNIQRVTGLYRTIQYLTKDAQIRWRTEVYDWDDNMDPSVATHRYWRSLEKPTSMGFQADREIPNAPRPAYVIDQLTDDGLPVGQIETALPIILGLYAVELQLATTEEVSAYPMLKVKGSTKGIKQVGPAEVLGLDLEGEAEWMVPGDLAQLRARRADKREAVRETAMLYAGSLGSETPSGEALIQANRVPQQADSDAADAVSDLLTDGVSRYLDLLGLPPVIVTVEPDQAYERQQRWGALQIADDLGAIPFGVKARMVQELLGGTYSNEELRQFVEDNENRPTLRRMPGEPA